MGHLHPSGAAAVNQDTPDPLMVPDASFMQNNLSPDQYYVEPRKMDFHRQALTRSPFAIKEIKHLAHNTPKFKSQSDAWSRNQELIPSFCCLHIHNPSGAALDSRLVAPVPNPNALQQSGQENC